MFGLEDRQKKTGKSVEFDLEKDVKNSEKSFQLKKRIESRVNLLKGFLQAGEEKKEFEQVGSLLYGYLALLKVIERIIAKKK